MQGLRQNVPAISTDDLTWYFANDTGEIFKGTGQGLPVIKIGDIYPLATDADRQNLSGAFLINGKCYYVQSTKTLWYYSTSTLWQIITSSPVQSSWSESDNTQLDYIKNKPVFDTTSADIQPNGTQAAGSTGMIADAGHVHPIDTTRASLSSNTYSGNQTAPEFIGSLNGNATTSTTASTLATPRIISTSGDVTATPTDFDGSSNITIPLTLSPSGVAVGTYPKVTVNIKGLVTNGTTLSPTDIPTLTHTSISDFDTEVHTSRLDQMSNPTSSVSMNNQTIINLGTPVNSNDAANKSYVDAVTQGMQPKLAVRVATTGSNITLSGIQTIDGILLAVGDRILVKDQTNSTQNGIYVVSSSTWSLSSDANSSTNIKAGMYTFVEMGTININTGWSLVLDPDITIVIGTTNFIFTQFTGVGDIITGTGLSKSGNTLSLAASGVTAGTYTKTTVDATGRVISATNLTSSDLPIATTSSTGIVKVGNGLSVDIYGNLSSININTIQATVSETLTAGAFVNIYNNSGTLSVRNANATDNTKPVNGFILNSYNVGNTATIYLSGMNNQLSGLTIENQYYLSTTNGVVSTTIPVSTGNLIQFVGSAINTTTIVYQQNILFTNL
jgi:phage-related tail fiber protein